MKVNLICILLNFITRTKLKTSSVLITLNGITSQSAMRNNSSLNVSETYNPMGDSNGYSKQELNYRIAIGVVNVFLCITAVFGNSAILLTIWKTSSLHLMANILLASLAVSDLAVGLVVQPLFIADLLIRTAFGSYVLILSNFLCIASLMTITAITADRLLALQLHLRYNAVMTPFRVTWVVFFIWVFTAIFPIAKVWIPSLSDKALCTIIISILVGNFFVYLKIYLIVRRHQRQIQHQQQEANNENIFSVNIFKKSAINTFFVYILLLCCYTPYSFVAVKMVLSSEVAIISPSVYLSVITLVYLNSSLNPLLYCWRDREICAATTQMFCG